MCRIGAYDVNMRELCKIVIATIFKKLHFTLLIVHLCFVYACLM